MTPATPDTEAGQRLVEELLEHINLGRSLQELLDCIYERLRLALPCNRVAVALVQEPGDHLRLVCCRSDGPEVLKVGYEDPIEGSTLQELLRTGQPRILNDLVDYLDHKPASRSTRLIVREGMRSNLTLPLVAGGKPVGVVFFSSRQSGAYHEEHVRLLRRLAGHLAVSVEKAQLIDALRERNQELYQANALKERFLEQLQEEVGRQTHQLQVSEQRYRLLVLLGQIVNASLDLREVFGRAAREIHRLWAADRVSLVLLARRDRQRHGFALEFGDAERWLDIPVQDLGDSAAAWVAQHRQARVAPNLEQARPFIEDRRLFEQGYRAYAYLPLLCRDKTVAVLGLAARATGRLERWDLPLLKEVAGVLATAVDNAAAYTQISQLKAELERENVYLRDELQAQYDSAGLIGTSRAVQQVRQAVARVAPTDSTVLIVGETGTGKEFVARAVHDLGPRRERLLVKVSCAALSPGVIASELFGHEAGSFTGATRRRLGRFELAHAGSIFLDEIAEVPPETQVLLLRVLQERAIERVGGNESIAVDVRVIAATNRDLSAAVADGSFRADLYYRLNVFPIRVPPLRERPEDVPALIEHFISQLNRRMNRHIKAVSRRTLDLLTGYRWPGNVRELEHLVERAVILSTGDALEVDPTWLASPQPPGSTDSAGLAEIERRTILEALERCGGKVYGSGGAAAILGLKPTTLYGKMRKHGIRKKSGSLRFE